MNVLLPFADFLWILQKEEYESGRYLYWLRRFSFRRNFVISEKLVYTARAKVTLGTSITLWAATVVAVILLSPDRIVGSVALTASLILIPLHVLLANLMLLPFFSFAHTRVRRQAQRLVAKHAPMQIVAVVGSYGKTTTKHFLYELVRHQFRTQMTPGTINTTTGIADWLIRELVPKTELLILEMDAYHRGEVAASCQIAPPSIVLLTNIGEQHLARFGTYEALRQALGEAVGHARADAIIIGDKKTLDEIREYAGTRELLTADTERLAYGSNEFEAPMLSTSNRENLARALAVATHLGIPRAFVEDTVAQLALPERRQQPVELYGYETIDDSYNISLSTARAGLAAARALAQAKGKKLLVIAAGIPELGSEQRDGNIELGQVLAESADHTIVLGTMFAGDIERGLGQAPHTRYTRLNDFFADSTRFPKEEWVLLLEPALPDLYY